MGKAHRESRRAGHQRAESSAATLNSNTAPPGLRRCRTDRARPLGCAPIELAGHAASRPLLESSLMSKTIRLRALTSAVALAISAASGAAASAQDLNAFRAAHGRPALRVNSSLAAMAQSHANDMARRGALDHNGFSQQRGPKGA